MFTEKPQDYGDLLPCAQLKSGGSDFERSHDYDPLGRPSTTYSLFDGQTHAVTRTYDSQSRLTTLTYPSGFQIEHHYTATGYLSEVRNASDNALYWQADAIDAYGQVSLATLGNGLTTMHHRDPGTGSIDAITTGSGLGQVQNLSYQWDAIGNLIQRHDNNQSLTETFQYDALNRLEESKLGGQVNLSLTYDAIGNIKSKSNVGSYQYGNGNAGPHAVTSVTGLRAATYVYDANGNMVSGAGRTLTWTSYNKPTQINGTLGSSQFFYGPDRARYKQIASQGLEQTTTRYIGKLYEERRSGTVVDQVHYIHAAGKPVAVYHEPNQGAAATTYLHRDHLGSVSAITDENGNLVEQLSYDAFGKRRRADWSHDPGDLLYTQAHASTRGYTGHEQLDNVKLVHMNGRVYDPILGRFLSPDPQIQYPN